MADLVIGRWDTWGAGAFISSHELVSAPSPVPLGQESCQERTLLTTLKVSLMVPPVSTSLLIWIDLIVTTTTIR